MKIYTRTGDEGDTGLFGGGRVSKAHVRVEAYGAVDELNAVLGCAIAELDGTGEIADGLVGVQRDLFALGAHLATPPARENRRTPSLPPLPPEDRVAELERAIDAADHELPALTRFILPGGSRAGAALHHARTVCRRAERRVIALSATESVDDAIIVYLNRLSDLLFTLARLANSRGGSPETEWEW